MGQAITGSIAAGRMEPAPIVGVRLRATWSSLVITVASKLCMGQRRRNTDAVDPDAAASLYSSLQHYRLAAQDPGDPAAGARIHPNDPQRLLRALEVYRQTGRPISELQGAWQQTARRPARLIALAPPVFIAAETFKPHAAIGNARHRAGLVLAAPILAEPGARDVRSVSDGRRLVDLQVDAAGVALTA